MPTVDVVTGADPGAVNSPPIAEPATGFDAALRRAADPRQLASVTIDDMLTAYASAGEAPPPGPYAGEAPTQVAGELVTADHAGAGAPGVLAAGERYLGTPYVWGGSDPSVGFDCSGFVQQVFADLGVSLPRVSADQSRAGEPVADLAAARPGDLVYWDGDGDRPNHIGIYAGDGEMLVAPRTGDVVRYQEITRTPDAIRRVM